MCELNNKMHKDQRVVMYEAHSQHLSINISEVLCSYTLVITFSMVSLFQWILKTPNNSLRMLKALTDTLDAATTCYIAAWNERGSDECRIPVIWKLQLQSYQISDWHSLTTTLLHLSPAYIPSGYLQIDPSTWLSTPRLRPRDCPPPLVLHPLVYKAH